MDSTNTAAKRFAQEGAPHGTVIIAGAQTGGRGRMGRTFQSHGGGMYLSVILRPKQPAGELMHLTCAAAVAAVTAITQATGIRPQVKWINDLVWQGRKLGGILTELSLNAKTGLAEYAIVGIGINCRHPQLSDDVASIATSLADIGHTIAPETMAAEMVTALWEMDKQLLTGKKQLMDAYRGLCCTLNRQVLVLKNGDALPGKALKIDDNGGLTVAFDNGCTETVSSGEVSVRGLWDYA